MDATVKPQPSKAFFTFYATFLSQLVHRRSVFIVTDYGTMGEIADNHELFSKSYITLIPMASTYNNSLLSKRFTHIFKSNSRSRPLLIIDVSSLEKQIVQIVTEVLNATGSNSYGIWKPTVLLIFKEDASSISQQRDKLQDLSDQSLTASLAVDSLLFAAFFAKETEKFTIWEMFRMKSKVLISLVKKFQKNIDDDQIEFLSYDILYLEAFAQRRSNFHLEKLTASVKQGDEFLKDYAFVEKKLDGSLHLSGGYVASVYHDLLQMMNFSESILIGDSPALKNGTLVGITMGQLNSYQSDLSLTEMSLTLERAKGVTFLTPTHNTLAYVFFKQPPPNSLQDFAVAPFRKELWTVVFITWVLIVLFVKSQAFMFTTNLKKTNERDERFVDESALWSVAMVCQKSWYWDPNSSSLRIKLLIGSLTAMILYTAYSAFIVSSLAITSIPIKSFEDLYKRQTMGSPFVLTTHEYSLPFQGLLQGYINTLGLNQKVVKVSTEREITHLFQEPFRGEWEGKVVSSKKAFLSYADLFYKVALFQNYSATFICNHVSFIPLHVGYLTKSSMVVKKGSHFKETLNFMLLHLKSVGLIFRNNQGYNSNNMLRCTPPEENMINSADPTTFQDVFTIMAVLLFGTAVSMLVYTVEIILNSCVVSIRKKIIFQRIHTYDSRS